MSSQEDLKAGHAPAVKAGGMRITQHKSPAASGATPEKKSEEIAAEEEEYGSEPKTDKHHQQVLVSGAVTKGDKDFTTEAVKAIHEKPRPAKDARPNHPHVHNINQPRKM
ncbi:death-associated protein 1 isoform X2 [Lingula anatina]|uniref:Death-associated protein 1 isoform X1 n=1 Tax=Lingula anatina TaxID=7574 RepID=A0A1S3IUK4_LINAN|nr:death-associated protein 1 isoform X1 [Lingula anatina]XP_013401612.1 death-associated protein 1 isoform X2 [Lingula anatina]|eukprot:XP_013401611.1 death-associated protein 1 isoform X1 [Lingula anatina]